jgi:hypothetical protein
MTAWLLISYVVGTAFGFYMGKRYLIHEALDILIDQLIEDGYIKTKGSGKNIELLKYWEKE